MFSFSLAPGAFVAAEAFVPVTLARLDQVSAVASAEFLLVEGALDQFAPAHVSDMLVVIVSSAPGFKAADAYCLLRSTGCSPPLHDLDWGNFCLVKVRVFISVL
jgi:hypothetical protein